MLPEQIGRELSQKERVHGAVDKRVPSVTLRVGLEAQRRTLGKDYPESGEGSESQCETQELGWTGGFDLVLRKEQRVWSLYLA